MEHEDRHEPALRDGPLPAAAPSSELGPGGEFDLVRALVARWGPLAQGIGGDCAELEVRPGERVVVSTDSSVEDVHFRRDWLSPREIGHRATAAALSDLAAAAARPLGLLLALTVPDRWRAGVAEIADGVGDVARLARCPIVGGDLTSGGELSLTVTVVGGAVAPLRRDGARPGDTVWVTGRLGGPRAALRAWLDGREPAPAHRERFARPVPRLREAGWLAARGATAAVDLSDGLVADLRHVAAASGVRIELDPDVVPRIEGATLDDALGGGEEYELIVTTSADESFGRADFEAEFGVPITRVGCVLSRGEPGVVSRVDLPGGHDHFSR